MERNDEVLWIAYREGDETAFSTLLRRYKNPLFGYLMRMVKNRAVAEDLFQETFLRVHRKAHTFREGARFKGWLYTLATRICIDHLRRTKIRPALLQAEEEMPERVDTKPDPLEQTAQSELRTMVQDSIATLPPKQRAVLVLAYYEGYTYLEVAQMMNCSLSSVKTHMSRALKKLSVLLPEGARS